MISNNMIKCNVFHDLHIPNDAAESDVETYKNDLSERISCEYNTDSEEVFILASPEELKDTESLSLAVSPKALHQAISCELAKMTDHELRERDMVETGKEIKPDDEVTKLHEYIIRANGYV
ncbi:MAG: hypothetical protein ACRC4H_06915 [Plesiomonas sp.]|nr:hypothetical protein [Edwardsiella ictaluri]ALT06064.1 putative transposase [Edwardsiella ictaluri]AMK48970.1 transposase [Edwardsiella ictaluri]AOX48531.1 hypothetical protein [Edwardsiella ictaluri]EKS7764818.1 hypothetical protein [Edwardsiella ictaluri]EKS7771725.1 hypothetical protein [Edwardsiella ictaluri]